MLFYSKIHKLSKKPYEYITYGGCEEIYMKRSRGSPIQRKFKRRHKLINYLWISRINKWLKDELKTTFRPFYIYITLLSILFTFINYSDCKF